MYAHHIPDDIGRLQISDCPKAVQCREQHTKASAHIDIHHYRTIPPQRCYRVYCSGVSQAECHLWWAN